MRINAQSLFRSPRPDFIETKAIEAIPSVVLELFRSPRLDFIETPMNHTQSERVAKLFRSPRPDFIETAWSLDAAPMMTSIVPVSKTGLH